MFRTNMDVMHIWLPRILNHNEAAKFLEVCEDEAADPHSSFTLMRTTNRPASGALTPIQEDGRSMHSQEDKTNTWHDDKEQNISEQAYAGTDGEEQKRKSSHAQNNVLEMKEKKKIYEEQHHKMEETGNSFRDSIRHEFESRPEP